MYPHQTTLTHHGCTTRRRRMRTHADRIRHDERVMAVRFLVARNPDEGSALPYLLRVPVEGEPLVLKAREVWPRTAKVYCHRAEVWPEEPEIVEDVEVRDCRRRGRAIDLVLARSRENRSQFVFAAKQGRELIFWQTARTAAGVRPGLRIPARRASGLAELVIVADTRERYAYKFTTQQATVRKQALRVGDYGVLDGEDLVAVVERKSVADLAGSLVDGSLAFAMADLATIARAAVVIDGSYADIFKLQHVSSGFVADSLARVQVRYPSVPVVFAGSRKLAEEWTYRFLGAARAELTAGG